MPWLQANSVGFTVTELTRFEFPRLEARLRSTYLRQHGSSSSTRTVLDLFAWPSAYLESLGPDMM